MPSSSARRRFKDMKFDVVVIGAGPAGGSAARSLSAEGLSVLIVDMRKRVGHPVQCGEAVSATALRENGVSLGQWALCEVKGIGVHSPSGPEAYVLVPGYCIDRASFDISLIKEAQTLGASLMTSCTANRVLSNASSYTVETSKGPVLCDYVVAADGPRSLIAESLGISLDFRCNVGLQYKFPSSSVNVPEDWLHLFLSEDFGGGYAWVFPRGPEVSVGVDVHVAAKRQLDTFCHSMGLHPGQRLEVNGGLIPTSRLLSRLGVGGVLVVGDAAGATNPIFGGGIHAALSTGRLAAETILEVRDGDDCPAGEVYHRRAISSPFFDPTLSSIAHKMAISSDEELDLAVETYRLRREPAKLLGLLLRLPMSPEIMPGLLQIPRLRKALQITVTYGW